MQRTETRATAGWGVAADGGGAWRVRLVRRGDGYAVELAERVTAAAISTWRPGAGERLGVVISDLGVMYRRLELPPAEGETLRQMAGAQLELASPIPVDSLQWSCRRLPDGAVLLAAARRGAVEMAAHDGDAAVLPEAAAVADAWTRFFGRSEPVVLVRITADATSVIVADGVGAESVAVVGEGLRDLAGDVRDAALHRWSRELGAAARQAMMGSGLRPRRCVVLHEGVSAVVLEACGRATALPVEQPPAMRGLAGSRSAILDALPAIGAACSALEPARAPLVLAGPKDQESRSSRRWTPSRRLIGSAIAAVLAVAALYGLDMWEASRVQAAPPAETTAETAQALGIARYLLDRPPPPLYAVAAISDDAPYSVQVKRLEYSEQGEVRFRGEARGIGDLDQALAALTKSPPLTKVELRQGSVKDEQWSFEVEAELVPLHRHIALQAQRAAAKAAATPATTETETNAEGGTP